MSRHPSIQRHLASAINAGCKAKTDRCIARYFLARPHLLQTRRVLRDMIRGYDGKHARRVADYRAERAKRLEHPDAKRASADKAFRRKYLRKLARLEAPFFAIKTLGKIKQVADRGTWHVDWAAIQDCSAVAGLPRKPQPSLPGILVPVNENACKGIPLRKIGKDWSIKAVLRRSYLIRLPGKTTWKNGMPVAYDRAICDNCIRSFGLIDSANPAKLQYALHESEYSLTLPDGYIWSEDNNGLKACRTDNPDADFHPDAGDLIRENWQEYILNRIAENAEKRAKIADEARAKEEAEARFRAKVGDVWVRLADSLNAGNCKAGSESWAARNGFNPAKAYPAATLWAKDQSDRVKLAILTAIRRDHADAAHGYCLI